MAGPLTGFRIVDLTTMLSGPWATSILGDQGADVIKVEVPGVGDHTRSLGNRSGGLPAGFLNINRSKRSVTVNVKHDRGKAVLKTRTTAQWLEVFEKEGVPSAPALTRRQVIEHPQIVESEIIIEHEHPVAGRLRQTRTAARFEGTPPDLSKGAPRLGEHNREILTELGFSAQEIGELCKHGAIGTESYAE